jgi:uncharacterized protein (DUF4415 family)
MEHPMPREPIDRDNPEWTKEDFAKARPAAEVLPAEALAAFGKTRGRPKSATPKVAVSLRLDADVVDAYKATGDGWQTRMNSTLREGARLFNSQSEAVAHARATATSPTRMAAGSYLSQHPDKSGSGSSLSQSARGDKRSKGETLAGPGPTGGQRRA